MVIPRAFTVGFLAALLAFPSLSKSPAPPPSVPAEVIAAAPKDTRLLAFKTSGDQPDANAVAVFETAPDKDGVNHRTLIVFRQEGRAVRS